MCETGDGTYMETLPNSASLFCLDMGCGLPACVSYWSCLPEITYSTPFRQLCAKHFLLII